MTKKLAFSIRSAETTSTQSLVIEIEAEATTVGGVADPIGVEIDLPATVLSRDLKKAVVDDLDGEFDKSQVSGLISIGGAVGHWSISANESGNDQALSFFLTNDKDEEGRKVPDEQRGVLKPGYPLTFSLPLAPPEKRTQLQVPYRYATEYAVRRILDPNVEGNLEVWLVPAGDSTPPSVPVVALFSDQESPTALHIGEEVVISWEIEDAIGAKLLGPLPGGARVLSLDNQAPFGLDKGHLRVRVMGVQTYLLQATVKGDSGQPNIQIVRTLMLDVFSAKKVGMLEVRPTRVLPHGKVAAHWAAWGVAKATIHIGDRSSDSLLDGPGKSQEGQGVYSFQAGKQKNLEVLLMMTLADRSKEKLQDTVQVVNWHSVEPQQRVDEASMGLAFAGNRKEGRLLSLMQGHVWLADVGLSDRDGKFNPQFRQVSLPGSYRWMACVAQGESFYLLGRSPSNQSMLLHLDLEGTQQGKAIALPKVFRAFKPERGSLQQMVIYEKRLYITGANQGARNFCEAWSIGLSDTEDWVEEPLLRAFATWQLAKLQHGIYALNEKAGQMVFFGADGPSDLGGTLNPPLLTAEAPNAQNRRAASGGRLVAVESILVVLGCGTGSRPLDQVYNPQTNRWSSCGHGLELDRSHVAYRSGGGSSRMWANVGKKRLTLSVGDISLFSRDFIPGNPVKILNEPFFNRSASFEIRDHEGFTLNPIGEALLEKGFSGLASSGPGVMVRQTTGSGKTKSSIQLFGRSQQTAEVVLTEDYFKGILFLEWRAKQVQGKEWSLNARLLEKVDSQDGRMHPVLGGTYQANGSILHLPYPGRHIRLCLMNNSQWDINLKWSDRQAKVFKSGQSAARVLVDGITSSPKPLPLLSYEGGGSANIGKVQIELGSAKDAGFHLTVLKESLLHPSVPIRFQGRAGIGDFDTGISEIQGLENYLGVIVPETPSISLIGTNREVKHETPWITIDWENAGVASGCLITIEPSIRAGKKKYDYSKIIANHHYTEKQKTMWAMQFIVFRMIQSTLPDNPWVIGNRQSEMSKKWKWHKKADQKTKQVFFESEPIQMQILANEQFHFSETHTQARYTMTAFRLVATRRLFGEPKFIMAYPA